MDFKKYLSAVANSTGLVRTSEALAREQYRALSKQIPVLYCVVIINCMFMAYAIRGSVDMLLTFSFPAIAAPMMLIRLFVWRRRAKKNVELDISTIRKLLWGNVIATTIVAFLLGNWAVAIMYSAPKEYFAYIPLFVILSMITCVYCLKALPAAAYSVMFTGTSYVAVAMLMTADVKLIAITANIALVAGLIIYMVGSEFEQLRHLVDSRSVMVEQRADARRLANRDPLTDMPNRRAFLDTLFSQKRIASNKPVSIVMIDMNGFKPINDTYGHAAGDELLINMGRCLSAVVENTGMVARLGGDEFAVLFTNGEDAEWAYKQAQLMIYEIQKPIMIQQHEIRMGAAFGIAHQSSMPNDPMELMQDADIALYKAKQNKFSAISLFENSMAESVRRRTLIEQALSDENQMDQIKLHFQPIFALADGAHVGFEALARWEHPDLGTITPTEFIGAAERNGLATKVTVHLFQQAIRVAKLWDNNKRLSFNISGSGLGASHLDKIIGGILKAEQFDPERLSIEVTETALLRDTDAVQKVLSRLQSIGVRIALDDFGAGYASIGYLQEMHFDDIKLDGSLINNIVTNARSRELLIGVLHLCKAVGADVTAEMVESNEQLELLKTLPITNIQGYLLGMPVPADDTLEEDPVKHQLRETYFKR
jgi:diguanylate cyclase (GGDEF)-like protein